MLSKDQPSTGATRRLLGTAEEGPVRPSIGHFRQRPPVADIRSRGTWAAMRQRVLGNRTSYVARRRQRYHGVMRLLIAALALFMAGCRAMDRCR